MIYYRFLDMNIFLHDTYFSIRSFVRVYKRYMIHIYHSLEFYNITYIIYSYIPTFSFRACWCSTRETIPIVYFFIFFFFIFFSALGHVSFTIYGLWYKTRSILCLVHSHVTFLLEYVFFFFTRKSVVQLPARLSLFSLLVIVYIRIYLSFVTIYHSCLPVSRTLSFPHAPIRGQTRDSRYVRSESSPRSFIFSRNSVEIQRPWNRFVGVANIEQYKIIACMYEMVNVCEIFMKIPAEMKSFSRKNSCSLDEEGNLWGWKNLFQDKRTRMLSYNVTDFDYDTNEN